jgi:hypothetical protein
MLIFAKNSFIGRAFPYFKWAIYGLLFINMILFFMEQTIIEGVESLAWLVLLLLLEWETSQLDKDYSSLAEKLFLQIGRLLAYILIVYSAYEYGTSAYIEENGILDIYNATIWIVVALLIEYEIFYEKHFHQIAVKFLGFVKIALYVSLFIIAILWQIDGEWLDFYDAALWIVCFFFIELNILQFEDALELENERGTQW